MAIVFDSPGSIEPVEAALSERADVLRKTLAERAEALDGFALLEELKFDRIGVHPITGRATNAFEQVTQTATCLAQLRAVRWIAATFPQGWPMHVNFAETNGIDIAAPTIGLCAEVFAAVHPNNNGKLKKDVRAVLRTDARLKYVFYSSPCHPAAEPRPDDAHPEVLVVSLGTTLRTVARPR